MVAVRLCFNWGETDLRGCGVPMVAHYGVDKRTTLMEVALLMVCDIELEVVMAASLARCDCTVGTFPSIAMVVSLAKCPPNHCLQSLVPSGCCVRVPFRVALECECTHCTWSLVRRMGGAARK